MPLQNSDLELVLSQSPKEDFYAESILSKTIKFFPLH